MRRHPASALWGKKDGGIRPRLLVAAVAAAVALSAPGLARAGAIPDPLLSQATANPSQVFDVIIQSKTSPATTPDVAVTALTGKERKALNDAAKAADKAQKRAQDLTRKAAQTSKQSDRDAAARAQADADRAQQALAQAQQALVASTGAARAGIVRTYTSFPAVSAQVTGAQLLQLKQSDDILAVTPNSTVQLSESNPQKWVDTVGIKWFWSSPERKAVVADAPTIAIVDSGIDATKVNDFGGRVLTQVDFTSLASNSPGDGRGHGTMVASIAAGGASKRTGGIPDAKLVSLDVINDNGEGRTADVIAAADWILQNRAAYNIRVANFSLHSSLESTFMFDPLSKAVERLWFNGIVVVAAAGNYADNGAASGVLYAPASDPFVITVGAVDVNNNSNPNDDKAAPWSAWGYTRDGFAKPELSAPGRYMIGAVPGSSTLAATGGQDPKLLKDGYLQLSGTSFAAPVVVASAAILLGLHPDWTPDQVKGALMLSANALPRAIPGSAGVGEVDVKAAAKLKNPPPNPNFALNAFLVSVAGVGPAFDVASWSSTARGNASWSSASWSSASWSSASWSSASWSSASWTSASWSSASWTSASWSSSTQSAALSLVNNAALDGNGDG